MNPENHPILVRLFLGDLEIAASAVRNGNLAGALDALKRAQDHLLEIEAADFHVEHSDAMAEAERLVMEALQHDQKSIDV